MKHVRTEILQAGMVIASDVIARNNQLVFPKGYVLTEKALGRLESYGIKDVRIEDPVGIEVEEIPEEDIEAEDIPAVDSSIMSFSTESLMSALTGLDEALIEGDKSQVSVSKPEEPSHF